MLQANIGDVNSPHMIVVTGSHITQQVWANPVSQGYVSFAQVGTRTDADNPHFKHTAHNTLTVYVTSFTPYRRCDGSAADTGLSVYIS